MQQIHDRLDRYEPGQFSQKFRMLFIVVSVALAILVLRLWYLQVIKGDELRQRSENNSVRLRKIKPMRGLIMDSARNVLVDNQASFDLIFIPNRTKDSQTIIIDRLKALYTERTLALPSFAPLTGKVKPFVPVIMEKNIGMEKLAVVETHALELPGVATEVTPVRQYLSGEMTAQIIGFTGEVSRDELENGAMAQLSSGDIIGKFGIEKFLDDHLRGKSGAEQVEVNVAGKAVRSLGRIPSEPGDNVVLTIDSTLQEAAWKALDNRRGAVAVLDPRNGAVLALVSSPSFDPNLFNGGISQEDWNTLANNPRHPMENRSISGQYPPGSTYKVIVAAAALEEGLITPDTAFHCNGAFQLGNRSYHCWQAKGHGNISLHRAIVESCDVYFYNLGKMLGVDKIAAYAKAFGLSAPLGIDLNREKGGLIPTRQWKLSRLKEPWQPGETISLSIGQGYNLVTPLQLANIYATLANGGTLYRPRLIKQLESAERHVIKVFGPEKKGTLPVSARNIQLINQALWGVVNENGGTGHALRRKEADVAGKTGTAQVVGMPQDEKARKTRRVSADFGDHALFACFAPVGNPEIAVAVILEHAGHGGSAAAPVARKIIDAYFTRKQVPPVQPQTAIMNDGEKEKAMIKLDRRLILNFDWTLLILVTLLSGIGLINIYSAGFSLTDFRQTPYYIKQVQWILIGFMAMTVAFFVNYRFLCRHAYIIYGISIVLLLIVFTGGYATRGSQRWIAIGGFTFQPSELVKLTLILALAKYFDRHRIPQSYRLRELFIPFAMVMLPVLFILKQPDLGTGLILLILFLSMVFFVGLDWRSLLMACAGGLVAAPIGWFLLRDYQKERIMTFFSPERDPLGSGYHIIQSMIAAGSGGLFGKGFLKGSQTQLKFLPEQQTDFVFSVFAEEWGFLGGMVLMVLFLLLILWGIKIIIHSKDYVGALVALGVTMLIFWEAFINIGMVLGILPVVGIPLPFLSYGGSSMVVLMMAVGLLMNISVRRFILQS